MTTDVFFSPGSAGTVSSDSPVCPRCQFTQMGAVAGDRCPRHKLALVDSEVLERHPTDPMLGRVLGGKYPVIGIVGSGGFATVYLALQEPVGRQVAVKVLHRSLPDPAARKRFFQEARVIAGLTHPATVTLHDFGEEADGTLYAVMERVRGVELDQLLQSDGVLSCTRAACLMASVLGSLAEAHHLGLVHRDIKPQNLLVVHDPRGDERIKVLDFGIAKVLEGRGNLVETRKDVVIGTPSYMAPEQGLHILRHLGLLEPSAAEAFGPQPIGPWTDVYACGLVLYMMLSGREPFEGGEDLEILIAQWQQPAPVLPAEAEPLAGVVYRALEKEPRKRFRDASDMLRALERVSPVAGNFAGSWLPVTVQTDVAGLAIPEAQPTARRGSRVVAAVLIVLVMVGGLAVYALWSSVTSSTPSPSEELAASKSQQRPVSATRSDAVQHTPTPQVKPDSAAGSRPTWVADPVRLGRAHGSDARKVGRGHAREVRALSPDSAARTPPDGGRPDSLPAPDTGRSLPARLVRPKKGSPRHVKKSVVPKLRIDIVSTPSGATIREGSRILGKTPLTLRRGRSARLRLRATLPGHVSESRAVDLGNARGHRQQIRFVLAQEPDPLGHVERMSE